jgi:hypothetical protein
MAIPRACCVTLIAFSMTAVWGCQMRDERSIEFLGDSYLLDSKAARSLFEKIRELPIVDTHNHADIVEIVENESWSDIW